MKEHPVLFAGPLVRAILDGRKTQTRRVVTPRNTLGGTWPISRDAHAYDGLLRHPWTGGLTVYLPRWKTGDRLWVREAWALCEAVHWPDLPHRVGGPHHVAFYREGFDRAPPSRWRPSIHMPRWASRITLEIESIRPERLTQISSDDVKAEGVDVAAAGPTQDAAPWQVIFARLWDTINGTKPGHAWRDDPWVWVTTFRRVET